MLVNNGRQLLVLFKNDLSLDAQKKLEISF